MICIVDLMINFDVILILRFHENDLMDSEKWFKLMKSCTYSKEILMFLLFAFSHGKISSNTNVKAKKKVLVDFYL